MATGIIAAKFADTVNGVKGEGYALNFPFEVNGFEYQTQEVNRCARLGASFRDVLEDVHKK